MASSRMGNKGHHYVAAEKYSARYLAGSAGRASFSFLIESRRSFSTPWEDT